MLTVYKYAIPVEDSFSLPMPIGARVLCVQVQRGEPCIWAMINTGADLVRRQFALRGTGHNCDGLGSSRTYVGTFQLGEGSFVGHLFDLGVP